MLTPNMDLNLPIPGTTFGPAWASDVNTALELVDSHDHTSTKGVRVPSAGLNINATLSFQNQAASNVGELRLTTQTGTGTNNGALRSVNGDLYYRDGVGNNVRITSGGALDASALGAIGGDYGISTALAAFYNANETFVFTRDTNEAAAMDLGPVTIRDTAASALGVTVKSPTSLAAGYQLTLLTGLPASNALLMVTSAGQIYTSVADNTTLEISGSNLRIKDLGVTTAKLADVAVTTAKLADAAVTTAKLGDSAVTQAKLATPVYAISGSSGAFATANSSFTAVTNLSASITATSGRVVEVHVLPADGTNITRVNVSQNNIDFVSGEIQVKRGSTVIAIQRIGIGATDSASGALTTDVGAPGLVAVDTGASGSTTYSIEIRTLAGAPASFSFNHCRLYVVER